MSQAGSTDPATAAAADSTAELLAATSGAEGPAALVARVNDLPPDQALAAVAALGRSREAGAARALLAIAEGSGPKELRKEARRGLHRLRARGLEVPRPTTPALPPRPAERAATLAEAWATAPDGIGSRALSLMAVRPLGGVYGVSLILNDQAGVKAATVRETTRRRYHEDLEAWKGQQPELHWVSLPPDYASQLIGEAVELSHQQGLALPQDFQLHQQALQDLVQPFQQALIYDELPAAETTLNPELLEASPDLFEESELRGWIFDFDAVRSYALDLLQARESRIVLSEQLQAERISRIIANAIRDVVTPALQRALARRLEEVAYVFLRTERSLQARQAIAAAQRLHEGATTLNPFLRAMMELSLEVGGEVETAKVPVERVRRSPYDPLT